MGTSVERASASKDLYIRGHAYGIAGKQVDGMDVLAVHDAGEEAVAHCRAGNGPYILEMKTYRYRGHSMSDPAKYRTREEVTKVREERDPIERMKGTLLRAGTADEAALKQVDTEVKNTVLDAAEFAQTSLEPAPEELYTDVLLEA